MHKIRDEQYLYLSARLRAMENTLFSKEKLDKLIDGKTYDDAVRQVAQAFGRPEDSAVEEEALLSDETLKTFSFLEEFLDHNREWDNPPELIVPFRYEYDCQNVKAILKCEALGISPQPLLVDCGTVGKDALVSAVVNRDFSVLPTHMARAAALAIEEFSKSKDPQTVDFILDRAVFYDMQAKAEEIGMPYLIDLIQTRADTVNLMAYFRCIRLKRPLASFLRLFLESGTLPRSLFVECYDGGDDKLLARLLFTDYHLIADGVPEGDERMQFLEKQCDNVYMERAKRAKMLPFGGEVAIGYLIGKQAEIKNIRIVLAGKRAGLAPEIIRMRLRVSYT